MQQRPRATATAVQQPSLTAPRCLSLSKSAEACSSRRLGGLALPRPRAFLARTSRPQSQHLAVCSLTSHPGEVRRGEAVLLSGRRIRGLAAANHSLPGSPVPVYVSILSWPSGIVRRRGQNPLRLLWRLPPGLSVALALAPCATHHPVCRAPDPSAGAQRQQRGCWRSARLSDRAHDGHGQEPGQQRRLRHPPTLQAVQQAGAAPVQPQAGRRHGRRRHRQGHFQRRRRWR
jgi:hypothetical protein